MWRFLLLVIFILLVGCVGGTEGFTIVSQESQNPELNPAQEITPDRNTPSPPEPESETMANLPNLGSAPELTNEVWLNSDRPLRLADLRGQVVLIEMWTFG